MTTEYIIAEYTKEGTFKGVIAGEGKNKGTWDTCYSRSAAYTIRKKLINKHPESVFKVELAY